MTDDQSSGVSFPNQPLISEVVIDGVKYSIEVTPEQMRRASALIKPKPVKTETNASTIVTEHRQSVEVIGMFLLNAIYEQITHHDEDKLQGSTEDEHHKVPHHATFNPDAFPKGGFPVWYLNEVVCDYLATVYGRALAGREFDILPPETHLDGWGCMMSTCLSMIHWMGLGTVTPEPEPLPGAQSEWRDGA